MSGKGPSPFTNPMTRAPDGAGDYKHAILTLLGKREQLSVGLTSKLTRYWSLAGSETVNLTNSTNLINGVATPQSSNKSLYATLAAIYQDECMAFISAVTQSGIRSGDVTPGVSVMFSVVFKNLGEFGGNILSVSGNSL